MVALLPKLKCDTLKQNEDRRAELHGETNGDGKQKNTPDARMHRGIRNVKNGGIAKRVSIRSVNQLWAVDKGLHAPRSRVPFLPIRWP